MTDEQKPEQTEQAKTPEQSKRDYQSAYYKNTLRAKRQRERETKKEAKAQAGAVRKFQAEVLDSWARVKAEEAERALIRAEERRQRDLCITQELTHMLPLADEPIEGTGESYLAWLGEQIRECIEDIKRPLVPHDFAAFLNAMSMLDVGRAILKSIGIQPLADAGWHRYKFVSAGEGRGMMRTISDHPVDIRAIEEKWEAAAHGEQT